MAFFNVSARKLKSLLFVSSPSISESLAAANNSWYIKQFKNNEPVDLLVEHLKTSYDSLNELIGNGDLDFLDKLFANFCVGK